MRKPAGDNAVEHRLRVSEGRLQSLVDTLLDGVITIDERGCILSYNKACVGLFGYTLEEVIGRNVKMLMPEPYQREHDGYIANYQRTRIPKIIGMGREVSGLRKDGTVFPMELAVSEMLEGGEHAFVGIVRNITERKEAERAREQLRQSQKIEALGQLTGGIAHDFNNLLAVILGNLDFMSERIGKDDPLRSFIRPSIEAAERGAELTQRLLAFGRKQALLPKVISINELVTSFLALAHRTLGERIQLVTHLAPDLWPAKIDPGLLTDALLNLSVNARDAMPKGGKLIFETANITLDHLRDGEMVAGDYAMLAVSDTGTGMAPEVIQRAFEPFFTTKETGKGTGLGLSMVYGFVRQSAGHIHLYSEPGCGTSVKIYLPRATEAITAPEAPIPEGGGFSETLHRILVVEDNPEVLKLTSAMVESLGYRVMQAENAELALQLLKAHPDIALLLTDVMLPGELNGPDLAKRAIALRPDLKVLFNSGYAEHAIFQSGILEEGVHLLIKPFRKAQLAQKLALLLQD